MTFEAAFYFLCESIFSEGFSAASFWLNMQEVDQNIWLLSSLHIYQGICP
tara:strand:- start:1 stop:150 length:150 start_codon:yes stop_codon:yes gene_type:complete